MKKLNILFAAIAVLSVVSCAKEERFLQETEAEGIERTFTCSFDAATTKTDIKEGKTMWAKGDSIWVSNGRAVEHFGVPESADGQKTFSFTSKLGGAIYVVYPLSAVAADAAANVDGDKVSVNIKASQDGSFGSANIAVAKTLDENVSLKNATSVLKFTVDAMEPINYVIAHANGEALAGLCSIDLSTGSPVVTASQSSTDVAVPISGLTGDFYISVVPGTFKEGFTLSAVTTELSVANKVTTASNEIKVNDLVDLGSVGTPKSLQGDGSKANPWQINNLGEMLAFAYHVNAEHSMEGQYVKLLTDIDGYTLPIGWKYAEVGNKYAAFRGVFDGNGKTIKMDINGERARSENHVGLFGVVAGGSVIKDLTVEGSVAAADSVGALVGLVYADSDVTIENVVNKASVTGGNAVGGLLGAVRAKANVFAVNNLKNEGVITATGDCVAGIIGYSTDLTGVVAGPGNKSISNCTNSGTVNAGGCAGGILGFSFGATVSDCSNSAAITSTEYTGYYEYRYSNGWKTTAPDGWNYGTGGIAGGTWHNTITDCQNTGSVTGSTKSGGICGTNYWSHIDRCTNKASVTNTSKGIAGGIVAYTRAAYYVRNCVNEGDVTSLGGWNGGIVGTAQANNGGNQTTAISNNRNSGKVTGVSNTAGIVGYIWVLNGTHNVSVSNCTNTGDVIASGGSTGGIIGNIYDENSSSSNKAGVNCTESFNSGNVTGTQYVGGIIGHCTGRGTTAMAWRIINCYNSGKVTSTHTTAQSYVGGLLGRSTTQPTTAYVGMVIQNSINTGDVFFSTSNGTPYAGGILGCISRSYINNVVNTGSVNSVSGVIADGQEGYIGAIFGSTATISSTRPVQLNGAFALEGSCERLGGANLAFYNSATNIVNYKFFSKEGLIAGDPITVNGNLVNNVVDALNGLIASNSSYSSWYNWISGPRFAKPVGYGVSIDDQNLDLGNGGNI